MFSIQHQLNLIYFTNKQHVYVIQSIYSRQIFYENITTEDTDPIDRQYVWITEYIRL